MNKKRQSGLIIIFAAVFLCLLIPSVQADRPGFAGHHKSRISTEARNERIVVEFYDRVFNQRDEVTEVANKYLTVDYIQHNPYVPTGRQGFIEALGYYLPTIPDTTFTIKRVVASGDLVVLHIHVDAPGDGDPGTALVDIFRVNKAGKISEHWDIAQQIPASMAHDNGMF